MKKIFSVLTTVLCTVLLAANISAADVAVEERTADLTLLVKGEFASVRFDPAFEETLSPAERIVYSALENGVSGMVETLDIAAAGYTDEKALTAFLDTVFNTHPLWNSIDDKVVYTVTDGVITGITLTYDLSDAALQAQADYTPTQNEIDHALSDITPEMSDLDKVLILHDYLVREVDYNLEVAGGEVAPTYDVYGLKGVFVNRDAVCQGYALAYSYLLSEVGVESMVVTSDPMVHAWNMVKLDGNWFHVDVTFDDPTRSVEEDNCRGGFGTHINFLRSDDEFRNKYNHYGWISTAPAATVSNAYAGYPFHLNDGEMPLFSYADGYYYCLTDLFGSDVMLKTKIDGTNKTQIQLEREYAYMFSFGDYLYANSANYVYELNFDGTEHRIVAATGGSILNFWLKQDVLAYYDVDTDGYVTKKTVDIDRGPSNIVTEGDFIFVISDSGRAVLTQYTGAASTVVIPKTAGGYPVTAIAAEVFKVNFMDETDLTNRSIKKVVIPEGVTTIGKGVFMYSNVAEVVMPDTLTTICDYAFFNCNYLEEIFIPEQVTYIGYQAFRACFGLERVYFEGDVPAVWGKDVFMDINEQITIYYLRGRTGWSSPTWDDPTGSYTYKSSAYGNYNPTIEVSGISLNINVLTLDVGESTKLIATVTPSDATDPTVTFTTSNGSVATVDASGMVTAKSAGSATITAKAGSKTATCTVTVTGNSEEVPGDINGDGVVELADALHLFQHSLMPDLFPIVYKGNIDFNHDGSIDIADALRLFQHSLMPDLFPLS